MSLREISDEYGKRWQVFDVQPAHQSWAGALSENFVYGWLCFLSDKGRRRIAPIPDGWEHMNDQVLRSLLSVAPPTGENPRQEK